MTWQKKKLGEVASVDWGNTSITKKQYIEKGYPAYSAAGQDGLLSYYEHTGKAIILSAIGAQCGKCFLAEGKWTAIKNTIVIIPDKTLLDIKYLFFYINDVSKWKQTGGAQPFISEKHAKRLVIPLPSLEIQKKIVAKIEELFAKIDKAIELRKKALAETEQIFPSALQKVFNETEKKWGVKKLGVNCEKIHQSHPKNIFSSTFRYIDITSIDSDLKKIKDAKEIAVKDAPHRARKPVKAGDVIFAITRPYLKNIAFITKEFDNSIVSTGFCVIRPIKTILWNAPLWHWTRVFVIL